MKNCLKIILVTVLIFCGTLPLHGCNAVQGDAWRYDPGIPAQVTGIKAESGNRLVTLSWTPSASATSYNIYYVSGLVAGQLTRANATKINVSTYSYVVEGLDNFVDYHFMVTALNRDGESVDSVQVTATPWANGGCGPDRGLVLPYPGNRPRCKMGKGDNDR